MSEGHQIKNGRGALRVEFLTASPLNFMSEGHLFLTLNSQLLTLNLLLQCIFLLQEVSEVFQFFDFEHFLDFEFHVEVFFDFHDQVEVADRVPIGDIVRCPVFVDGFRVDAEDLADNGFEEGIHMSPRGAVFGDTDCIFDGIEHTFFIGDAFSCFSKCSAVIDRDANNREADGNINTADGRPGLTIPKEAHEFNGDMALIVVHGNDDIKGTGSAPGVDGIAGDWAFDIESFGPGLLDSRDDFVDFFIAYNSAFTGMGIEAAHQNDRLLNAETRLEIASCPGSLINRSVQSRAGGG